MDGLISVLPLAAVLPEPINIVSPGSGPILPLPVGGAYRRELTPVHGVSFLPPLFQQAAGLGLAN